MYTETYKIFLYISLSIALKLYFLPHNVEIKKKKKKIVPVLATLTSWLGLAWLGMP